MVNLVEMASSSRSVEERHSLRIYGRSGRTMFMFYVVLIVQTMVGSILCISTDSKEK